MLAFVDSFFLLESIVYFRTKNAVNFIINRKTYMASTKFEAY